MTNSNLVLLFQQLNKTELRAIKKFVRSPFFNQRTDVIQFCDYLIKYIDNKPAYLSRKKVFAQLYPGETYDDAKMNSVMHFLLKLLKEFITYQEVRKDEANWQLNLCRSLRKRNLDALFKKHIKKLEVQQEKQPFRNVGFHYHKYQLELERYEYEHNQSRSGRMNLQELAAELTIFYLADILRHSCTVITAQKMSQQDYKLELLEEVLQYVERSPVRNTPAVAIYHQAYKALSEPEVETAFEQYEEMVEKYWTKFPREEAMDIYHLAINYCIQKLNRGQKAYIRKAFELYKKGLEREVLLDQGIISKYNYKNVLMLAIALKEWEWAEWFLETYKSYLPAKERENIYQYNLAIFYFRKPDYDKAMHLLQHVTFQDVLYNLNARSMLLRIYYELEEFDALESLLESFRAFIRRHNELGYHKENYANLIGFMRRLLSLPPGDVTAREKLRQQIENTAAVAEKPWLLSQIS